MFLLRTHVSVDCPHKYFNFLFSYVFVYVYVCMYVYVCVCACACIYGSQRIAYLRVDFFFPSSIWVLGIEFMLSGSVTNTFTH